MNPTPQQVLEYVRDEGYTASTGWRKNAVAIRRPSSTQHGDHYSASAGILACVSKAVCLDCGAGGHLVDTKSHRYKKSTMCATDCTLEAVGHEVQVNAQAQVVWAALRPKPRQGLVLEGTPDCACLGMLVEDEGHDFLHTRRTGPVLIEDESLEFRFPMEKAIFCDSIDYVTYLPSSHRGEEVKRLAAAGYAAEVQWMENASEKTIKNIKDKMTNPKSEFSDIFDIAKSERRGAGVARAAKEEDNKFYIPLKSLDAENIIDVTEGKTVLGIEGYNPEKTAWVRNDAGCWTYRTTMEGGPA